MKSFTFIHHHRYLTMKDKEFDCVAFQHRAAEKIYEETKGMTIPEELAYWQRYTDEFQQRQQARWEAQKSMATFKLAE